MSYKIEVSRKDTPVVFNAMLALLEHIKPLVNHHCYEEVAPVLESKYGIILHRYNRDNKESNDTGAHLVEFASEQDFTAFMLRWS